MKQKVLITLVIILGLFPTKAFGEEVVNAGIVSGVWFSKMPFFNGDKVTIYTAFQNQSNSDLEGSIQFIDNESVIEEKPFSIKKGDFVTRSTVWTATYGDHTFKVKIQQLSTPDGTKVNETSQVADSTVQSKPFFSDNDTDMDNVGDEDDTDDDNDTIPDSKEIEMGTDPKNKDSDRDGILDNEDAHPTTVDSRKPFTPDDLGITEDILDTMISLFETIDYGRENIAEFLESNIQNIKKTNQTESATTSISSKDKNEHKTSRVASTTQSTSAEHEPFYSLKNIGLFLLNILHTLMAYSYIFYPLLLIPLYLIIRYIRR